MSLKYPTTFQAVYPPRHSLFSFVNQVSCEQTNTIWVHKENGYIRTISTPLLFKMFKENPTSVLILFLRYAILYESVYVSISILDDIHIIHSFLSSYICVVCSFSDFVNQLSICRPLKRYVRNEIPRVHCCVRWKHFICSCAYPQYITAKII